MHIFDKSTFQHSFCNMDLPIERMHQTIQISHTSNDDSKILFNCLLMIASPTGYLSDVVKCTIDADH